MYLARIAVVVLSFGLASSAVLVELARSPQVMAKIMRSDEGPVRSSIVHNAGAVILLVGAQMTGALLLPVCWLDERRRSRRRRIGCGEALWCGGGAGMLVAVVLVLGNFALHWRVAAPFLFPVVGCMLSLAFWARKRADRAGTSASRLRNAFGWAITAFCLLIQLPMCLAIVLTLSEGAL